MDLNISVRKFGSDFWRDYDLPSDDSFECIFCHKCNIYTVFLQCALSYGHWVFLPSASDCHISNSWLAFSPPALDVLVSISVLAPFLVQSVLPVSLHQKPANLRRYRHKDDQCFHEFDSNANPKAALKIMMKLMMFYHHQMAVSLLVLKIQWLTIVRLLSCHWLHCILKYVSRVLFDQNILCHIISIYLNLYNKLPRTTMD